MRCFKAAAAPVPDGRRLCLSHAAEIMGIDRKEILAGVPRCRNRSARIDSIIRAEIRRRSGESSVEIGQRTK